MKARIVWDAKAQRWFVRDGLRRVRSFPTLLEAEQYVTRGVDCPDEVDAS